MMIVFGLKRGFLPNIVLNIFPAFCWYRGLHSPPLPLPNHPDVLQRLQGLGVRPGHHELSHVGSGVGGVQVRYNFFLVLACH